MMHKISSLQSESQNVHSCYISLQGVDIQFLEALSLLSHLFTIWGPYIQLFDNLASLLLQNKELPKIIIINARKMIGKVKELHGFSQEKCN